MRYELNMSRGQPVSVQQFSDRGQLSIPLDADNSDFMRFLAWLQKPDDGFSLEDQALRSDMREHLALIIAGIDPSRIERYGREVP